MGAVVLASTSFLALAPVHAQKARAWRKNNGSNWNGIEVGFENYFGEDLASVSKTAAETADELHRLSVATFDRRCCMSFLIELIFTSF